MSSKSKGKYGEDLARKYYIKKGCKILEINYRYKRYEIDLIVLSQEKLLIFVEVKSRDRNNFGEPESFVSIHQQERIKDAAEDYIFGINWKKDIRFDIVSIDRNEQLTVFEDAF